MPQVLEPVAVKVNGCREDCPFCAEAVMKNYRTKHGLEKDEDVLGDNLAASGEITNDKGPIYPLAGGNQRIAGWEAKPGVLESFAVKIPSTPHHIIPGKAAMAKSHLEDWTRASKGKIKQDIGYTVDGPPNGIWLPHMPEIYWRKHFPGTKTPMAEYFGQTFAGLSESAKNTIGEVVMGELSLQMHYMDHSVKYTHTDPNANYDRECKMECDELGDRMQLFADEAKCPDATDNKLYPPYPLVAMINGSSTLIRQRITGSPTQWTSWVSPLAHQFTHILKTSGRRPAYRGWFSTLTF